MYETNEKEKKNSYNERIPKLNRVVSLLWFLLQQVVEVGSVNIFTPDYHKCFRINVKIIKVLWLLGSTENYTFHLSNQLAYAYVVVGQ